MNFLIIVGIIIVAAGAGLGTYLIHLGVKRDSDKNYNELKKKSDELNSLILDKEKENSIQREKDKNEIISFFLELKKEKKIQGDVTPVGHITGGDDYPEFRLLRNTPSPNSNLIIGFYFMLEIYGKNPLNEFKVRVIDIQNFRIKSSAVYHTDLQMLDLNFPTPFVTVGKLNHPRLVYSKDYGELKPAKKYVLPDPFYKSPNEDIVLNSVIALDKNLPFQGFNIYCESANKYWFYEIRFITKGEKTEWAIQQREISENNEWKLLDSESDISEEYDLLDEGGNPVFYGK